MPKFLLDIRGPFVWGFVEDIHVSNAVWINLQVNNAINFPPYILGFFYIFIPLLSFFQYQNNLGQLFQLMKSSLPNSKSNSNVIPKMKPSLSVSGRVRVRSFYTFYTPLL